MNLKHTINFAIVLVVAIFAPHFVCESHADVVVLKNGGRIQGDVVATSDPSYAKFYLVRTRSGVKLTLARTQVERVERTSPALREYSERLPKIVDTVEGHLEIAEWCFTNKLHPQRSYHLEQILRHDPNHKGARYGLGYSRVDGEWVKTDEWNLKKGYVRHALAWRTRQEAMVAQAKDKFEMAEKQWLKDLKMWRGWYDSKRKHATAMDNFKAIDDPMASMGVVDLLEREKIHPLKVMYIEILGRLNTPKAHKALMELAIEDESRTIRTKCIDQLVENKSRMAIAYFVRQLDPRVNKNNQKINRAGTALGRMKDPAVVMAMIDALETVHVIQNNNSESLTTTFSNLGANGLSTGGAKTIKNHVRNEEVLNGLQAITGVRLGWDKEEWRRWYVRENTPQNVNLRRTP